MKVALLLLVLALAGGIYLYYRMEHAPAPTPATANAVTVKPQETAKQDVVPPAPARPPHSPEEFLAQGRYAEAQALLDKVPEAERNEGWKIKLAEVKAGLGDTAFALKTVDEVLALHGTEPQPDLLLFKARLEKASGALEKAEDTLSHVFLADKASPAGLTAAMQLSETWRGRDLGKLPPGKLVNMNLVLTKVLDSAVDENVEKECLARLEELNQRIFFSPYPYGGLVDLHKVQPGESVSLIAKKYKIYPDRVLRANRMKRSDMLQAGRELRIIQGHVHLRVNRDKFLLTAYLGDMFFKRYHVGVGKEGSQTPHGVTRVSKSMAQNPPYKVPATGQMLGPEDPANPIGSRWIGLDMGQGYGIHGTREPDSIGKKTSNGCIRLTNEDVEDLYDYVMVGDEVTIE